MEKFFFIAAGGAIGSILRYLVSVWSLNWTQGSFPIGTLVVNVTGCALIGLATAIFAGPHWVREGVRFGLLIGLLGAFTTFSTFSLETIAMIGAGQVRQAVFYVLASNGCGLIAVWLAYHATRRMLEL